MFVHICHLNVHFMNKDIFIIRFIINTLSLAVTYFTSIVMNKMKRYKALPKSCVLNINRNISFKYFLDETYIRISFKFVLNLVWYNTTLIFSDCDTQYVELGKFHCMLYLNLQVCFNLTKPI